jgi:alpha-mannosidase
MYLKTRWHAFTDLWPLLIAGLIICGAARTACAQQIGVTYSAAAQTESTLKSLSSASQAVMERLSKLNTLPVGDLRYFAGDVPNGASVDLDDSSWQTIQIPFTASNGEVWLRKWVVVPKTFNGYDPTGAKIWLEEPTRGDVAVYCNGQRLARGEDMEPIVLLNQAKSGDKFLLAIRLGKTNEPKRLRRMAFRIGFAPNRPNPEVLRTEFLSSALLLSSLAPGATSTKNALEQAIQTVDLKALDNGDAQAFDGSLRKAKEELDSIKPTLQKATFHLTGNSHIDAAWLWPWTETVDVVKRTFGSAAQLMDEYPTYTYTQSAAQYNVWMAD